MGSQDEGWRILIWEQTLCTPLSKACLLVEIEVGSEGLKQKNLHRGKAVGNTPSVLALLTASMRADQISAIDAKNGF